MERPEPVVLVIDDDAGERLRVAALLRENGYACAAASPGAGALALAARVKPRLVLARRGASRLLAELGRLLPGATIATFDPPKD
jgi:CheY-like chemotaxis protein